MNVDQMRMLAGRFLIWLPLALYGLFAAGCIALEWVGVDTTLGRILVLSPVGSFLGWFYIFYLALWKLKWTRERRIALAVLLPLAPLALLAMLDVAGVEIATIPLSHGLPVLNVGFWLVPGMVIARPVDFAIDRLKPSEPIIPEQTYVRGGIPQTDGSLILYGDTTNRSNDFETLRLLARLDAAGNADTGFALKAIPLDGVLSPLPFTQPDGTVLIDYTDFGTGSSGDSMMLQV